MTASRRLAPLLLLLTGLAALAGLVLVPWVLQAQSQEVTQTADATGGNPPAKPTNLQASAGHDEVVLTWTASSDQTVTHYAILRRNRDTDATGVFHVIESNAGPGTSYTDGSVAASSRYNYRVKAVSPTGVSQWSGYVQAETPAAPPPTSTATPTPTSTPTPEPVSTPTPEDLRPTGLTVSLVENKVTLSWTAPAEDADSVTGYEILRRRPMEGETALATLAADTESTATTYTDATANEAGVRYVYRVKALRGSEASLWSNFYAIDLPADYEASQEDEPATATTPGAPSLSTLMIVTSASIILSWSEPADDGGSPVTGYRIEYSEDSGDTWQTLVEDTGTTETEYTHGGLEPETTLHYRVLAINEHGAGPPSDAVSATTLPAPEIALPQVSKDSNVFLEFNIDTSTVILTDQDPTAVLIKNTAQTSSGSQALDATNTKRAQAFTTGSNSAGYTLSSIGFDFASITDITTAGAHLAVTLNADSSDNPASSALCTLTDPAMFSASGVNTFDAPATGTECPTLAASTTYFAVIERVTTVASATITLHRTGMAAEDAGGAMGWSIGDDFRTFTSGAWGSTATQTYLIEVEGSVIVPPPPVLIKNTGQSDDGDYGLGVGGNSIRAQAFTTGANAAGYTLSSIGFSFGGISNITTAGGDLAVTLNGVDNDGNPDAALCTLTDPGTFSGSGVQTFDAPTMDPCETLTAETTYFAVVQRVANTATSTISLDVTANDNEDTGGATGWTIGDDSYVVVTPGTAWVKNANFNHQLAVRGYAVNNPATGAPSISGVLEKDEVLTADTAGIADVDVLGAFSYQWLADGTAISGATSSTYTLTAAEVGDAISLTVTFTDGAENSESLTSAATHNVVAGGATRKLLWVGTLTPADVGLSYIGFVDTMSGSLSPTSFIDGSTTHAFETIEYKAGFGLAIVVRPGPGAEERVKWIIDAGGEFALFDAKHIDSTLGTPNVRSEWLSTFGDPNWSIGTETVVYLLEDLNNRATGAPSISGALQQDEELTADTAGIADADGLSAFSYQWLAGGTAISGATSSTYTLTASEVGDAISLRVTFTDDEGYSESLTSAETHDVVASGATRKLLWLGTLTPGDRGSGAVGVNVSNNDGFLSPFKFTYGSDTYTIDQIDFGPLPSSGLLFAMSPVPGADEEEAWIVDTGREWLVTDEVTTVSGGQIFVSWAAVEGDVEWTIGQETVVYLLEVVNNPPAFTDTAPTTRSVDENTASASNIGAAVAATDADNDTLVYGLTGTDASSFSIDSTSGQLKTSASLDFETDSSYSVSVTVHDGKDGIGGDDTTVDATIAVTISVINKDEAGTVTLPATFTGGTAATASVSDLDGTVSSPSWRWARGITATGSFSNIGGATAASYTPVAADVGKYLRATVTYTDPEGSGKTASAVSSSAVGASNAEPTFSADSATRTLPENSGAGVDVAGGTISATDSDSGDTLTYSLTGTDSARFEIDSSGQIKVKTGSTHTFDFEATKKSYSVTVNVRDSKDAAGNADTATDDTIAVTIDLTNVNEAPVILSPETTVDVRENRTLVIVLEAGDLDALDTKTWSVESADDGGTFEINAETASSAILTFKNAPDFETPTDVGSTAMNNTYVVKVKVEDAGGLSDTHTITVTVTNVNEAPEITTTATTYTDFDVDENTATSDVIKTYVATDVDESTTLTWTLEGNDAGDFTITKNADGDGELQFRNAPNFEIPVDADTMNDYDIRVKVQDNGIPGNRGSSNQLDDTVSVEVTVLDVNEAPEIFGHPQPDFAEIEYDATSPDLTIGTYTYTDEDRNPADTITWRLRNAFDAAHFNISSTGVLSFNMRPDFENPVNADSDNEYLIDVEADDGQGGVGTAPVLVTVTNVDETPEITTAASSHTAPSFMEIEYDASTPDLVVADYDGRDEEDDQNITWSKAGADASDFTIDTATGVLSFAQRPNFEMPEDAGTDNEYNVTVRVTDTTSPLRTTDLEVVVTVTDVNERPDINEDTVPSYVEIEYDADTTVSGTLRDVHTFTATDYDDMDTFEWSLLGTDAAYLEIDATTGVLTFRQDSGFGQGPLPNFEYPRDDDVGDGSSNTYSITVRATDDDATDQKFTDYAVVVTVTDVNEAPEFTGTPDTAITLDEHDGNTNYVVMDQADYDARDEEGGVTWSLTGTDRSDFSISADGVVTFVKTPNYEAPEDSGRDNVYEFSVVATDVLLSGSSRRDVSQAVTVTVGDVEEAGTLTVDNLIPAAGETVTFVLTDPDGSIDTTSMTWVIQSLATGGSWARVSGVLTPASTTFPWTVDEDVTGKAIRAMVTYTDRRGSGKVAVSRQTAQVTADPIANAPPRFRGGSTWSVEEGPAGRNVGTPTAATDRDNDTLTYGIQSSLDSTLFEIDPSTGQVSLAQALDFETTPAPQVLFFYLTLHDGRDAAGNTEADPTIDATRSASIAVVDVEEDGVVTLSVVEPETGMQLTATLEDGDGGVTGEVWQWARSENGRTGWTNISGAASSSYTPTVADEDFFLRATVTYTDRRGAGKSAEGITGRRVPSENRSPVFPPTEDGQRTVPENTRAGRNIGEPVAAVDPEQNSLTYTLTGTDAAAFTVVASTGQLRTSEALDFEAKPSYSITVEVHDGRDGAGNTSTDIDDTQAVTITVENEEEPGTVTLTTPTGTIQARAEVTAALEDDDIPTGVTWQWSRSPNGRTDWVNIQGATSATYTPTLEEDRGNYIRATASYTDGEGPNKTANAVSARVGDPPPVNSAPVFPSSEDGRREVAENSAEGSAVGTAVAATDLNAGDSAVNDPLVYSLTGTDAASFTIDSGTGQISVAASAQLDYEGKRSYRVTVEVTDGKDQNGDDDMDAIDDRQNVTITVTNVNEAPVVTGDETPSFQEDSTTAIATYTATDPERDTLTWSVSVDDFWISSRGQLYFRTPPSFEVQTSYQVTVTATDDDEDANLSGSLSVTVTVTDAEEEGVVTIEPTRGWDGTIFQVVLDDDDGNIIGETWQWARSTNRSRWDDIPNATSDSYTAVADDVDKYLRATVSYEDARGSNKEAEARVSGRIGASADRPTTNNQPEFREDDDDTDTGRSTTRTVREGTAAGRNVGSPVRAADEDRGDVLTYSLSGTDAVFFDIDPVTGQIQTKAVLDYDPDGTNSYSVQVRVHDGFGPDYQSRDIGVDATIDVTVTVTAAPVVVRPPSTPPPPADEEETTTTTTTGGSAGDGGGGGGGGGGVVPLNRSPSFTEGAATSRSVAENAVVGEYFGAPLAATDPDGDTLTYTLGGAGSQFFDVNPTTGRLRVKVPLDYETRSSYSVVVRVADGRGAAAFIAVTVAVVNVGLDGLVGRYDTDHNGAIGRDEAIAAVVDYFDGVISKEEAIAVITVYFAS